MAAEPTPPNDIKDATKDLKSNSSSKVRDVNLSELKDGGMSDAMPCVSSADAKGGIGPTEVDQVDFMSEHSMHYPVNEYYGYYYPGFLYGEWDEQGYILGTGGLEVQQTAIQEDNASAVYYFPGLHPGYIPLSPFFPEAIFGVDGQYLGQQPCNSSPIFSQPLLSPGHFPQPVVYGTDLTPSYTWEASVFGDGLHGNKCIGYPTIPAGKPNFSSKSHKFSSSKPSSHLKPADLNKKELSPAVDISPRPAAEHIKPMKKAVSVLSKSSLHLNKLSSCPNNGKNGLLQPHGLVTMEENVQSWAVTEKPKPRSKTCMVADSVMLNEQNQVPKTINARSNLRTGVNPSESRSAEKNSSSESTAVSKDHYNLPDFPTLYEHALFFVIKSYSEDDIHKSIKYNVWTSTSNGNRRLDNAYQVAQGKIVEEECECPVFLFFSVNASGQFCGVAEMIGGVDFNKNMEFWQQDKWNGFFPVKWHIIKDIPNPQFRHIVLENNDNKPVTNSRDTQEVKYLQGSEMLKIFKSYPFKTSILDDFDFYEKRQKEMQDRKIKETVKNEVQSRTKTDEIAEVKTQLNDVTPLVPNLKSTELAAAPTARDELLVKE